MSLLTELTWKAPLPNRSPFHVIDALGESDWPYDDDNLPLEERRRQLVPQYRRVRSEGERFQYWVLVDPEMLTDRWLTSGMPVPDQESDFVSYSVAEEKKLVADFASLSRHGDSVADFEAAIVRFANRYGLLGIGCKIGAFTREDVHQERHDRVWHISEQETWGESVAAWLEAARDVGRVYEAVVALRGAEKKRKTSSRSSDPAAAINAAGMLERKAYLANYGLKMPVEPDVVGRQVLGLVRDETNEPTLAYRTVIGDTVMSEPDPMKVGDDPYSRIVKWKRLVKDPSSAKTRPFRRMLLEEVSKDIGAQLMTHSKVLVSPTEDDFGLVPVLTPVNLLGHIWLQLMEMASSSTAYLLCAECGEVYRVDRASFAGEERIARFPRATRRYCSDACRKRHHRKGPQRAGEDGTE